MNVKEMKKELINLRGLISRCSEEGGGLKDKWGH